MNSKQKGMIGEAKITQEFLRAGFHVFREFGDNSRIDLIVEAGSRLLKVQVKTYTSKDGRVFLNRRKSGPNYNYKYDISDVDIFAVYVLDLDKCFFVKSDLLCAYSTGLTFRVERFESKNNQALNVHFSDDYTIERILRDYTPNTLTNSVEGDDIVQTTTAHAGR